MADAETMDHRAAAERDAGVEIEPQGWGEAGSVRARH
jgi:hypothetical protein